MGRRAVVLGAGTGGLAAAARLRELLPAGDEVVLIDRSFTAHVGFSALRVLRGWRDAESAAVPVRPAALPGVTLATGVATGVDIAARTVRYDETGTTTINSGSLDYDGLIVALGADTDAGRLPGFTEAHVAGLAGEFYSLAGAAELRRRLTDLTSGRVVVLIPALPFTCPPAPYEAALLIADLLGSRFTGGAVRVDVLTCEPRPVAVADSSVGSTVVDLLAGPGIGFHPEKTGPAIDSATRTITFADGTVEGFDLLAVVPPHASPAATLLPQLVNAGGWLPVDPATLATAAPGVWAVGDVTALPLAHGLPAPKAGFIAENAGVVAAQQLARHLGYPAPDDPLTAVGGCIVEVGGGLAAKIAGDFLAAPAPAVRLAGPAAAFHAEKAALERDWLARWG